MSHEIRLTNDHANDKFIHIYFGYKKFGKKYILFEINLDLKCVHIKCTTI